MCSNQTEEIRFGIGQRLAVMKVITNGLVRQNDYNGHRRERRMIIDARVGLKDGCDSTSARGNGTADREAEGVTEWTMWGSWKYPVVDIADCTIHIKRFYSGSWNFPPAFQSPRACQSTPMAVGQSTSSLQLEVIDLKSCDRASESNRTTCTAPASMDRPTYGTQSIPRLNDIVVAAELL